MKFTFKTKWTQNILLASVTLIAVAFAVLLRATIESFATSFGFFILVLILIVGAAVGLLLISTISVRTEALANSRVADLLETQKLFVELYRNSPVPYVLVDSVGKVTYPNHAANHLFGLGEQTFEGRNIFDMFEVADDEGGAQTAMVLSRFSEGVFVESKDIVVKCVDGSTRFGLLSIFPYGGRGKDKKGLMTIVDITKQKEVENAKSEFLSLASHQMRTPISSMKWNLELLTSPQFGTLSEQQAEYHKKVVGGLTKMNLIIEDFLSVSQLEMGTKALTFEQVDLKAMCDDICEEFTDRVTQKNLKLNKQYDERITTIETDKRLLFMSISNLMSNATKYTLENGEVTLQYVSGYDTVTFTITDTGVGIPAPELEQLFSKFFRASNVREQIPNGTGLGLYIIKLAIEKLGGTISVRSELNVGTTFDVVLPQSSKGRTL